MGMLVTCGGRFHRIAGPVFVVPRVLGNMGIMVSWYVFS
jgi:hypothetical protein